MSTIQPTIRPVHRARRRVMSFLAAFVLLASLTLAAAPSASAGWNGQQIMGESYWAHSMKVCAAGGGSNQYGQTWVCSPYVNKPAREGRDIPLYGWWWKGTVTVYFYWGYNGAWWGDTQYPCVPQNQPGNDWVHVPAYG